MLVRTSLPAMNMHVRKQPVDLLVYSSRVENLEGQGYRLLEMDLGDPVTQEELDAALKKARSSKLFGKPLSPKTLSPAATNQALKRFNHLPRVYLAKHPQLPLERLTERLRGI
jgi:hypothetical protein